MAQAAWTNRKEAALIRPRSSRLKYLVAGVLMLAAVVFLVVNAMAGNTLVYLTVEEYYARQAEFAGRDLRVSGWVVDESVQFSQIDATTSRLEFDVVDNLEQPGRRLHIVAFNEAKPDLLQGQAQALVEGRAEGDAFVANPGGLFLRCPTRYEELEPAAAG
ncbi:MAG: cytochrome c maturation protein CcmE [Candidatus Promineifilaceae bacterium]